MVFQYFKMNITFITNSIGFGGAEKILVFVANNMANRGHKVTIINYDSVGDYVNTYQRAINKSITVTTFSTQSSGIRLKFDKILFAYKTAHQCQTDVLVCFTSFPSFVGKIIGSLLKIPSIMSERGNPYVTINKKNLNTRLELSVINRSDGAVFQTKGAAEFFSKRLQLKGTIIPNPIFIDEHVDYIPISHRENSIVSVGRLDNFQKRYDIMIKAFALFVKRHSNYVLKIYGTGADEEKIKQFAINENIKDKVFFKGVTNNPIRDISTDGIFLITSDYEGISNSLLEAMAAGLPCVSTDSSPGGARMLIDDKINGLLCPIRDPNAIAEALNLFAENKYLADKCGKEARKVIYRFDKDAIIDKWENYIKSIIQKYN